MEPRWSWTGCSPRPCRKPCRDSACFMHRLRDAIHVRAPGTRVTSLPASRRLAASLQNLKINTVLFAYELIAGRGVPGGGSPRHARGAAGRTAYRTCMRRRYPGDSAAALQAGRYRPCNRTPTREAAALPFAAGWYVRTTGASPFSQLARLPGTRFLRDVRAGASSATPHQSEAIGATRGAGRASDDRSRSAGR